MESLRVQAISKNYRTRVGYNKQTLSISWIVLLKTPPFIQLLEQFLLQLFTTPPVHNLYKKFFLLRHYLVSLYMYILYYGNEAAI